MEQPTLYAGAQIEKVKAFFAALGTTISKVGTTLSPD
jgi:hypothetical protein